MAAVADGSQGVGGMVRECEVVGLACECGAVHMGEEG